MIDRRINMNFIEIKKEEDLRLPPFLLKSFNFIC